MNFMFSKNETGSGESSDDLQVGAENHLDDVLDKNMAEYEWSVLTVEIPTERVDTYLAKVNISFMGTEIAIRSISIEP